MTCNKSKCINEYVFELPYHHSLLNDTINIGDTIWITSNFGPELIDNTSGEVCTFNNINFQSSLIFGEISGNKPRYQNEKFILINVVGSATLSFFSNDTNYTLGKGSSYKIEYEGTKNYKLKLGFIAKEKGLYNASYGSPALDREKENITTKCNGGIYITGAINGKDTAANNFHLTSYSNDNFFKNISVSDFQKNGLFCFVVK